MTMHKVEGLIRKSGSGDPKACTTWYRTWNNIYLAFIGIMSGFWLKVIKVIKW